MAFDSKFIPLRLSELHREAAVRKVEGWRFIQTHAVNTDDGIDLYYSFMKDGVIENLRVQGVKDEPVPSITDMFLAAFVFENEARELFGVNMQDIAIDFHGGLYAPAEQAPMTFMTPEQKAAREKARGAAKAKAAKGAAAKPAAAEAAEAAGGGFVMTAERKGRLDAKMATMSPEKIAKVEAALKARGAEAAAAASAKAEAAPVAGEKQEGPKGQERTAIEPVEEVDAILEAAIALMDPAKAEIVRAALKARPSSEKGGE